MCVARACVFYRFFTFAAAYLYGWWAFPLGWLGLVVGSELTWVVMRWLIGQGRVSPSALRARFGCLARHMVALEHTFKQHGFQSVLLVQLCYTPFGITNALLSMSDARHWEFFAATCCSRVGPPVRPHNRACI